MSHYMIPSREEIGDPLAKFEAYRRRKLAAMFPVPTPVQEMPSPDDECEAILSECAVADGLVQQQASVRPAVKPNSPSRISVEDCITYVCKTAKVSKTDLLSHRRNADLVMHRQIAMYLAKKYTLWSLPFIGRRFGGRDHTTVLHAVRKIRKLEEEGRFVAPSIEEIELSAGRVQQCGEG